MNLIAYLKNLFCNSKQNESVNVVDSIVKAKKLHKKLILQAHPDRNQNNIKLAKELAEEINCNRFNYKELLRLQERVNNEL